MKRVALPVISLFLTACAEGHWAHPAKSQAETQRDWEICKAEVLTGKEYEKYKDTMAGSVNLSGCMRSKGYEYVTGPPKASP